METPTAPTTPTTGRTSASSFDGETPRLVRLRKGAAQRLRQIPIKRTLKRALKRVGQGTLWLVSSAVRATVRALKPTSDASRAPEGWPALPSVGGEEGRCRVVLNPDSWLRQLWNCWLFGLLAWPALMSPFVAGFVRDVPPVVELAQLVVDGLALLDMLLLLTTATFDERSGRWEVRWKHLVWANLRRPLAVLVDVLVVLPLERFALPVFLDVNDANRWDTPLCVGAVRGLRFLKLLRLCHAGRLWRLSRLRGDGGAASSRSPGDPQNSLRRQFKEQAAPSWTAWLLVLLLLIYWTTCSLRGLASFDEVLCLSRCRATDDALCDARCADDGSVYVVPPASTDANNVALQLVAALHWTVGAMRGPAFSPLEEARLQLGAAVLVMAFGSVLFALLLGELLHRALAPCDDSSTRHRMRSDAVRRHMRRRRAGVGKHREDFWADTPWAEPSLATRRKLGSFFNHSQSMVEEQVLFQQTRDLFGKKLLAAVDQADAREWLCSSYLSLDCPASELGALRRHLAVSLVPITYCPRELVVEPHALNTHLIVINQGFCRQRGPSWSLNGLPEPRRKSHWHELGGILGMGGADPSFPRKRGRGSVFGEEFVLRLVSSKPQRCGYTVETLTHVNTLELDHETLERILKLPSLKGCFCAVKRRALKVLARIELPSLLRQWHGEPDVDDLHGIMLAATGQLEGVREERRQREQLARAAEAAEQAKQQGISARQMDMLIYRFDELEELQDKIERLVKMTTKGSKNMRRVLTQAQLAAQPKKKRKFGGSRPGSRASSRPSSRGSTADEEMLDEEGFEPEDEEEANKPVLPPAHLIALIHPDIWKKYWKKWIAKYAHKSELKDLQERVDLLVGRIESLSSVMAVCNRHPHLEQDVAYLERHLMKQNMVHQKLMRSMTNDKNEMVVFREHFDRETAVVRGRAHTAIWDVPDL